MVSLCLWWRAICDPPANRLNTHTHTRNYTLIEACMCFGWTTAEHARFTIYAYVFFFWTTNGLKLNRKTSKRVRHRYKFACVKSQQNTASERFDQSTRPKWMWMHKRGGKKKYSHSKYRIERLMLSSYGVYCVRIWSHKIYFRIYYGNLCVRPRPSPSATRAAHCLTKWPRAYATRVFCRVCSPHHTSESVCVNFKCNWHLCTSTRWIESMHSSAHRERGERVPQTFMCFCPVDISNEMNKLNNSLWHSMCYSTAEYVEYVFHFFFSFVCLACAPVFFSLSSRIIYSMVAAVHLTLFNDAFQFPFNI